jgi:hypothetical protein
MKQQNGAGTDKLQSSAVAPISDRGAQRISVIEPKGEGIKVCDGHAFDPHRFQEFDFTPAFREKMMRAPLPLLDLRQLHEDKAAQNRSHRAGPNDVTQPATSAALGDKSSTTAVEQPTPSRGIRLLLAPKKLRKTAGSAQKGKTTKRWKFLLFGSLLATLGLVSE